MVRPGYNPGTYDPTPEQISALAQAALYVRTGGPFENAWMHRIVHNRKLMVFHPAWGYFADTYGLVQVPIQHEGKEPGARMLATRIDQARQEDVGVVFLQPQFYKRQAEEIAQAINGRVSAVYPLASDHVANLRRVARQFTEALRH